MSNQIAPDDATLADYLDPIADELATVQADIKKAQQREKELKDELRAHLEGRDPGDYPAGMHTVRVTIAHTVDAKAIERDYPANVHPYLYDLKPSTTKVRAQLDEEQIERYLVASAPRIGLA